MSFQEKSAIAMTGALAVVYGAYFAIVGRWLTVTPADEIVYQPLLIVAIVPLVVLAVVHALLLAWVLAELVEGATRIALYRRGT